MPLDSGQDTVFLFLFNLVTQIYLYPCGPWQLKLKNLITVELNACPDRMQATGGNRIS